MSCCNQHATHRETLPNISSYPVAYAVLSQAVANTWARVQAVLEAEMSTEELEEANGVLAAWLAEAFAGQNSAFDCETEFNEKVLVGLLRESVGDEVVLQNPHFDVADDDQFFFNVFAYLVSEIFVLFQNAQVLAQGLDGNPAVENFLNLWTMRLTGAPFGE